MRRGLALGCFKFAPLAEYTFVNVQFAATPSGIFSGCADLVRGTVVRIEPR